MQTTELSKETVAALLVLIFSLISLKAGIFVGVFVIGHMLGERTHD